MLFQTKCLWVPLLTHSKDLHNCVGDHLLRSCKCNDYANSWNIDTISHTWKGQNYVCEGHKTWKSKTFGIIIKRCNSFFKLNHRRCGWDSYTRGSRNCTHLGHTFFLISIWSSHCKLHYIMIHTIFILWIIFYNILTTIN